MYSDSAVQQLHGDRNMRSSPFFLCVCLPKLQLIPTPHDLPNLCVAYGDLDATFISSDYFSSWSEGTCLKEKLNCDNTNVFGDSRINYVPPLLITAFRVASQPAFDMSLTVQESLKCFNGQCHKVDS